MCIRVCDATNRTAPAAELYPAKKQQVVRILQLRMTSNFFFYNFNENRTSEICLKLVDVDNKVEIFSASLAEAHCVAL